MQAWTRRSSYTRLGPRLQTTIYHCLLCRRLCKECKGHQLLAQPHLESSQSKHWPIPIRHQQQRWIPTWIERIRLRLHWRQTSRIGSWRTQPEIHFKRRILVSFLRMMTSTTHGLISLCYLSFVCINLESIASKRSWKTWKPATLNHIWNQSPCQPITMAQSLLLLQRTLMTSSWTTIKTHWSKCVQLHLNFLLFQKFIFNRIPSILSLVLRSMVRTL